MCTNFIFGLKTISFTLFSTSALVGTCELYCSGNLQIDYVPGYTGILCCLSDGLVLSINVSFNQALFFIEFKEKQVKLEMEALDSTESMRHVNTIKSLKTLRPINDNLSTSMELQPGMALNSNRKMRNTVMGNMIEIEDFAEELKTTRRMTQVPRLQMNDSFFNKFNTIRE